MQETQQGSIQDGQPRDRARIRRSMPRQLVAEASAMFLYVLAAGGAIAFLRVHASASEQTLSSAAWLFIGIVHGLTLFVAGIVSTDLSGVHLNPAVTVGLASVGKYSWRRVPAQLGAQAAGAIAGAATILLIYGRPAATIGQLGGPIISSNTTFFQALVGEGLGTLILMLPQAAGARDKRLSQGWSSLAAGLMVVALTMEIGPSTTAMINPARAFGPEIIIVFFGLPVNWGIFVAVFVLAPVLGAVAGAKVLGWIYGTLKEANVTG